MKKIAFLFLIFTSCFGDCFSANECYKQGVKTDYISALCDKNDKVACLALEIIENKGTVDINKLLPLLVEKSQNISQKEIDMYSKAIDTKALEKACEYKHAISCNIIYNYKMFESLGVLEDFKKNQNIQK